MNVLNLVIAAGTLVLFALLVAALAGTLQRLAHRVEAALRRRADRRAGERPLTAADVPVAAEALAFVAEVEEADDAWPLDVDIEALFARQDYEIGVEFVHDLEARLAAGFALSALAGRGAA